MEKQNRRYRERPMGRGNLVFLVGNPRLLRRFAPPASPGEAGAGLAMTITSISAVCQLEKEKFL
jgi:hypothetical protein